MQMPQMHPIEYFFSENHPMSQYVKCNFTGSIGGKIEFATEAPAAFVRSPETGELHSGFASVVLDTIMGGAVMGVLTKVQHIATIGMTIHHRKRPIAGQSLSGSAHCRGVHNDIAFVTSELKSADDEILAFASGTFMIGTTATSIRNRVVESRV